MHSAPIDLCEDDKLDILQRLDCFHRWKSVDEKRRCRQCGKVFTGQDIRVFGGTRGCGPLRLECPTEGCCSTPNDWVVPESLLAPNSVEQTEPAAAVHTVKIFDGRLHPAFQIARPFSFFRVPCPLL